MWPNALLCTLLHFIAFYSLSLQFLPFQEGNKLLENFVALELSYFSNSCSLQKNIWECSSRLFVCCYPHFFNKAQAVLQIQNKGKLQVSHIMWYYILLEFNEWKFSELFHLCIEFLKFHHFYFVNFLNDVPVYNMILWLYLKTNLNNSNSNLLTQINWKSWNYIKM